MLGTSSTWVTTLPPKSTDSWEVATPRPCSCLADAPTDPEAPSLPGPAITDAPRCTSVEEPFSGVVVSRRSVSGATGAVGALATGGGFVAEVCVTGFRAGALGLEGEAAVVVGGVDGGDGAFGEGCGFPTERDGIGVPACAGLGVGGAGFGCCGGLACSGLGVGGAGFACWGSFAFSGVGVGSGFAF